MVIKRNEITTIKSVLEGGADVNAQNSHSETALMSATKHWNAEIVKLLERGGCLN